MSAVYEHWRPDTNQCFYVGKCVRQARARQKTSRNPHWWSIVNKLKSVGLSYEIKFVAVDVPNDEALRIEIERIQFWRNQGVKLCNMTNGGEGLSGFKQSLASVAKRVAKITGKKRSPEVCAAISAAKIGHFHTEETKAKISRGRKGIKSKPHIRILSDEGREKIRQFMLSDANPRRGKRFVGKKHTPEMNARKSLALKNRWSDPEFRDKMSVKIKESWAFRRMNFDAKSEQELVHA